MKFTKKLTNRLRLSLSTEKLGSEIYYHMVGSIEEAETDEILELHQSAASTRSSSPGESM